MLEKQCDAIYKISTNQVFDEKIYCSIMDPFLEAKIPIPHCRTSFVDDTSVIFLIEFRYSYSNRLIKFFQ